MRPPKMKHVKLATLTYAAAATPHNTQTATSNQNIPQTAATTVTPQITIQEAPYDYHAEIQRITTEIETKLRAKLDAAVANLQATVDALEQKFEQKLNQQVESLKANQADKITQDSHSHDLKGLSKSVRYLVAQISLIADKLNIPTPQIGVGRT